MRTKGRLYFWSTQEVKERKLSELNLSDNDLKKAKDRAKNLMKLVDLDKINKNKINIKIKIVQISINRLY